MLKFPFNFLYFSILFFLISCANYHWPSDQPQNVPAYERYQEKYSVSPPRSSDTPFYRIREPLQCVPYAREISRISIRGNAHTWWRQAQGRYMRSNVPRAGTVMVLSQTSKLRYGHLAVVSRVIDNRNIEVTHSNWGSDRNTRSIIYKRMPVVDTSPNNDWSQARFWDYPSRSYGSIYPVSGFIYPEAPRAPLPSSKPYQFEYQ